MTFFMELPIQFDTVQKSFEKKKSMSSGEKVLSIFEWFTGA